MSALFEFGCACAQLAFLVACIWLWCIEGASNRVLLCAIATVYFDLRTSWWARANHMIQSQLRGR